MIKIQFKASRVTTQYHLAQFSIHAGPSQSSSIAQVTVPSPMSSAGTPPSRNMLS